MVLKQRIQDFLLLLKQDRKVQLAAAATVAMVLYMCLADNGPRRGPNKPVKQLERVNVPEAYKEDYQDLVKSLDAKLEDVSQRLTQSNEAIKANQDALKHYEETTTRIFKKLIEQVLDVENRVKAGEGFPTAPVNLQPGELPEAQGAEAPEEQLAQFGDLAEQEVAPPATPKEEHRRVIIGVGDSVRVKLLAGVNAPTDGTPYPTLFKLNGDVQGPDGSSLPLGEGRLLAAAQGSLTDHRALFRLSSLNIRFPDGSRGVYPVDGWVVGEDGIRGMEGVLIDPLAKIIAGTALSGFVEGAGQGISDANTIKIVTPYGNGDGNGEDQGMTGAVNGSLMEYALGEAMGKGAKEWRSLIEARTAKLVPHVAVYSGRTATAVFSKNLTIDGLYEQLEGEDTVYASLD